ncbi:uncharacterized protein LOC132615870 isoform X3 [Lycium barbarum]|uniref:uncharacterized protein LOC132615870 isoform X3 n=1 Tax=Lycium barbarum TaxID=112863 RepID=UPI00293ED355|nr:uncharacterized protein LOC132615870 isoform X3 [Lycium barbarum]
MEVNLVSTRRVFFDSISMSSSGGGTCVRLNFLRLKLIPGSSTDTKNGDLGPFDTLGDLRVTWDVILDGYKGVFSVMNCKGKGRFVLGLEGWFLEELPTPGCCSSDTVSGLVADLRLGLKVEDGRAMVEKISAGILSIVSWRYLFVEDALSDLPWTTVKDLYN